MQLLAVCALHVGHPNKETAGLSYDTPLGLEHRFGGYILGHLSSQFRQPFETVDRSKHLYTIAFKDTVHFPYVFFGGGGRDEWGRRDGRKPKSLQPELVLSADYIAWVGSLNTKWRETYIASWRLSKTAKLIHTKPHFTYDVLHVMPFL